MKLSRCIAFAVLISLAGLFAGCADDGAAPSNPAAGNRPEAGAIQVLRNPASHAPVALGMTSATRLISASTGGDLVLGEIRVRVPAGALPADTTLTLTLLDLENCAFRVEPAGLKLSRPVSVTVGRLSLTSARYFRRVALASLASGEPVALPSTRYFDAVTGAAPALGDFGAAGINRDGTIELIRYLSGPGFNTRLVQASRGGEVTYDRYRVTIPAGALSEDTYITVRDPGNGYVCCELEPHGIQFRIPVTLTMDLRGLDLVPFTDWTIFWYNDQLGVWEDQGAIFANETMSVPLHHFSTYEGGRAGW